MYLFQNIRETQMNYTTLYVPEYLWKAMWCIPEHGISTHDRKGGKI